MVRSLGQCNGSNSMDGNRSRTSTWVSRASASRDEMERRDFNRCTSGAIAGRTTERRLTWPSRIRGARPTRASCDHIAAESRLLQRRVLRQPRRRRRARSTELRAWASARVPIVHAPARRTRRDAGAAASATLRPTRGTGPLPLLCDEHLDRPLHAVRLSASASGRGTGGTPAPGPERPHEPQDSFSNGRLVRRAATDAWLQHREEAGHERPSPAFFRRDGGSVRCFCCIAIDFPRCASRRRK